MCNTYIVRPSKKASDWRARVSDEVAKLKVRMICKTLPGVVVLQDGSDVRTATMRWGFSRHFNNSVNNSRDDKLGAPMWKDAFENRRCVVPVSLFYEWAEVPLQNGRKQAYQIEFPQPTDDWIWIAGIWEDSREFGPCYSLITTATCPAMAHIHDRMPAILPWHRAEKYLGGGTFDFSPYTGALSVSACDSPLITKGKRRPDDPQGNLFGDD